MMRECARVSQLPLRFVHALFVALRAGPKDLAHENMRSSREKGCDGAIVFTAGISALLLLCVGAWCSWLCALLSETCKVQRLE